MAGDNIHVQGFKPPDEKWQRMKAAWDACTAAGVNPPKDVSAFFNHEEPDSAGVEVDEKALRKCGAVTDFSGDMQEGFEVHVDKVPKDVKVVRVYASY